MLPENWKELTHSSRNAVFAAFVLVGVIAAYNWIIAPHRNYLLASQQRESVKDNLIKKNQAVRDNLKTKTNQLERLQKQFSLIQSSFFDPVEAHTFLSNIQNLARQENCILSSLNFLPVKSKSKTGPPDADRNITTNRAKLTIIGGYKNLVALISRLQDRPQQVLIKPITVASISESPGQLKCEATIMIYVIHDKETTSHD